MTKDEMRQLLAALPKSTRRSLTTKYAGQAQPGNGKTGTVPKALRMCATRCSARQPLTIGDVAVSTRNR